MNEQDMIDEWCEKYIETDWQSECKFCGYKELAITNGFCMGYIECWWDDYYKAVNGLIWLDDDHAKCPEFFRDAVLWHEFCHFWDCVEEMHVDHCGIFQKKKFKKPLYAIGDIVLKLIGWIWFD